MFIAGLFTIAKTRKQSKCPSTEEWIKKMWYMYTMEYCSCLVTKSCLTLRCVSDCSPPGSSVCGIYQARILEWVAISSSRGSSQPRIGPKSLYHTSSTWSHCPILHSYPQSRFCRGRWGVIHWDS